METPLPNFYFMGVQFIHLLALSIWVGGILILQIVVFPGLFRIKPTERSLFPWVSGIHHGFHRLTLFCSAALILTSIIKFSSWENMTPWNLSRYLAIVLMSSISLYAFFKISPRFLQFLQNQRSDISPALSEQQSRLYCQSTRLMLISMSCGLMALLMA